MRRGFIRCLFALVLLVFIIDLVTTGCKSPGRILWTAPDGERIVGLRTSPEPGHVYVISSCNGEWFLRTIDARGKERILGSGRGHPQPMPITATSWDGKKLLLGLGLGKWGGRPLRLVEYDLRSGKIMPIAELSGATSFNLLQPYSPKGEYLLLTGSYGKDKDSFGVWLLNRKLRRFIRVSRDTDSVHYISWSAQGDGFVYFGGAGGSGCLLGGRPPVFKRIATLPVGSIGFVEPSGQSVLIVKRSERSTKVIRSYIGRGGQKVLYTTSSEAIPIGIQYSRWGGTLVDFIGPGTSPVVISPNGEVKKVNVKLNERMPSSCALISKHNIVVIEKDVGDKRYRLTTAALK